MGWVVPPPSHGRIPTLVTPPPFRFVRRVPDGALARFVAAVWYARGTVPYDEERIVPTGSTVGIVVLGDPIRQTPDDGAGTPHLATHGSLVGPHDRPLVNAPTGETHAVGIVTTPVGCEAVFGAAPRPLRGRVVPLAEVWPLAKGLRADLLPMTDAEAMLDQLVRTVRQGLAPLVPGVARGEAAVARLVADPTRPIADLARELRVSHAHLDRELNRLVGLTPRVLARLLRMQRLLGDIDETRRPPWGDLAAAYGWFDQAHLIRDFKRHTGVTPTAYLKARRAIWAAETLSEAPGFVPR